MRQKFKPQGWTLKQSVIFIEKLGQKIRLIFIEKAENIAHSISEGTV